MAPAELVRSGEPYPEGSTVVTPKALVHTCEECGQAASFGEGVNLREGRLGRWRCGWRSGRPVCLQQLAQGTTPEPKRHLDPVITSHQGQQLSLL